MASLRLSTLPILGFLIAFLLVSLLVRCDDDEDHLLEGINSYRQSSNLPALAKHDKAHCLADEIADGLQNHPCPRSGSPPPQITNLDIILERCDIEPNTTKDGAVLPVCVPKRVPTLVLTNYTQSEYAKYINDSKFTGVGIGTEDNWTVLVLTTGTEAGMFAATAGEAVSLMISSRASVGLVFLLQLGVLLLL